MRILRLWPTEVRVNIRWLIVPLVYLCLLTNYSLGQNYCDPAQRPPSTIEGGFTLDKNKVCVGDPVTITAVQTNLANVAYFQQYTGTLLPPATALTTTFTYTLPGSYTIIQVGSGNGTSSIACRVVTVLPRDPVKVSAVKTCSGRRVEITIDPATVGQYDSFVIRWNDGSLPEVISRAQASAPIAHTYAANSPATNRATVNGVYSNSPTVLCEGPQSNSSNFTFPAAAASQPVVTRLTTLNDNTITIQYQAGSGIEVQLLQKDASGIYAQTYQKGTGSGAFTVSTNAKQTQCFRLAPQDACGTTGAQSDEVCSLALTAEAANQQNNLSWEPYKGTGAFRRYRINRNGSPTGGLISTQSRSTYEDKDKIECGVQYCYSIEAEVGPTIITSAPACVTGINGEKPADFRTIVVSIENGHPRIVAAIPTTGTSSSYTMTVSRADGTSGTFQPVGTVANRNTFVDSTANPSAGSYCYQLTYQNKCGLVSNPSPLVCTIFLDSKSSAGIDWTSESPFSTGPATTYTVEVIDSLNGTKQEINLGSNTHYEPDPNDPNLQSQKYRIIAVSDGGVPSYSNFYTLRREARILAPDAFTPNGDGTNDTFVIRGVYVDQFRMSIYDRWGKIVYSTTDKKEGWDGTADGQAALAGQYLYRIEVVDLTGQKTVRTGGVLLIR